jgi:hypothetical protein
VLVGASIGAWIGGIFGGFVAALLSIPAAGALQVIVREGWRLTGPPLRVAPTDPQQAPLPDQPEPPVTDEQEAPVTDEQEESASHQLPADGVNVPGRDPVGQRIAAERNSLHHPK